MCIYICFLSCFCLGGDGNGSGNGNGNMNENGEERRGELSRCRSLVSPTIRKYIRKEAERKRKALRAYIRTVERECSICCVIRGFRNKHRQSPYIALALGRPTRV